MERFLVKTGLLKSFDNSPLSHSFDNKSFTGNKTPKDSEKIIESTQSRKMKVNNELLLKIFSCQSDQPLDANDLNKRAFLGNMEQLSDNENISPDNCYKLVCEKPLKRNDLEEINDVVNIMSLTPTSEIVLEKEVTPLRQFPYLSRLNRDLNSPSATARIRALHALKNPSQSAYNYFDVPHEEQDIITAEERHSDRPKSIQEVMKDVVIYAEVRTGEDNRSAGVKKVISSLGAKVNDKLLRDTTHVIFKDGLQSTYNKAKKWKIPIVSILWIEACKNHMTLMNPSMYPISNVDRYENPELYQKIKRQKSMQPDAEEKTRRYKSKQLAKETEMNKTAKISSALKMPRKPKDKLDEILMEFQDKIMNTPEDIDILPHESKLLQRLRNSPFNTPRSTKKKEVEKSTINTDIENINDDFEESKTCSTPKINSKKSLQFNNSAISKNKSVSLTNQDNSLYLNKSLPRRNSIQTMSKSEILEADNQGENCGKTQLRRSRRSSISAFSSIILPEENETPKSNLANNRNRRKTIAPKMCKTNIMEENCDIDSNTTNRNEIPIESDISINNAEKSIQLTKDTPLDKNKVNRRTNYSPHDMEESHTHSSKSLSKTTNSSRRRTLFNASKAVAETLESAKKTKNEITSTPQSTNDIALSIHMSANTSIRLNSLLEEYTISATSNSVKTPQNLRRKTLFDISMDIIDQRLKNINKSAKLVQSTSKETNSTPNVTNSGEKLYTPKQKDTPVVDNSLIAKGSSNENAPSTPTETMTPNVPKKRKLFAPAELMCYAEHNASPIINQLLSSANKSVSKPSRVSLAAKKRNRNELDEFENVTQSQRKLKSSDKIISTSDKAVTNKLKKKTNRRSTLDFVNTQTMKTTSAIDDDKKDKKLPFMVYTNMHTPQIEFIKEAVKQLGGFQLENNVTENTTHVVSLEPRRTINMLRGIIRGVWIMDYKWVEKSVLSGKWLNEEQFELHQFSRAVKICRSERQSFGSMYKMDLFSELSPIYVSPKSKVPYENVKELIKLCSGRVVEDKSSAKYIIGELCKNYPDKMYVEPAWILDSITKYQLKKPNKYFILDD